MKFAQRPLLPIVLLVLLLACGIAIARSRTIKSSSAATAPVVECVDECKEKLEKMLLKCEDIPEARRESCREAANTVYNKCAERCGERTR